MTEPDLTLFWTITAALALVVALLFHLALRGGRGDKGAEPAAAFDLRVYRDQLREVERDLARGVVDPADADRVRAEISRRILAADAALKAEPGAESRRGAPRLLALAIGVLLVAGSLGLYSTIGAPGYGDLSLQTRVALAEQARANRPGQAEAEASMPAYVAPPDVSPDYAALVEQLRGTVAQRPDDLQGHVLLAQNEANLGNYAAAARAQGEVVRILGDGASAQDHVNHADMLVIAAGGYVSPEAEQALTRALALDPTNGTARYYIGLMMAQTGRPDTGFRIWDQLLREGPRDALWIAPILAQIEEMAHRAGVAYQLPEIGGAAPRGPSAADIEAAGQLSPTERMEMIRNMVQGLSDRLATEGGPVEDWTQLITALGVLGQTAQARAVYENAIEVFAEDGVALDMLLRAGQQAQVAE